MVCSSILPGSWHVNGLQALPSLGRRLDAGASPEAIVEEYDALKLGDVYAVITHYLRHKDEVAAYLAAQEKDRRRSASETKRNFLEGRTDWAEASRR